jgi:hypothetical protein
MDNLVKPMDIKMEPEAPKSGNKGGVFILIIFFGVLLGVLSGFTITKVTAKNVSTGQKIVTTTKEAGVKDSATFKDSAEGKLIEGGINGEGTHHLKRAGGESQNVYLTSSVIDLGQFVGKNVKVYGQTNASQTAGWFMDVGRIEVK